MDTGESEDTEALQREYERYKAAVQRQLTNVDEATAQRTRAVRLRNLLSPSDIEAVHRAARSIAERQPDATIDRSAWGQPNGTWRVTFLNSGGAFERELPDLYARIRAAALAVDREHWNLTHSVQPINYRVAEYHTMRAMIDGAPTRGGLHTRRHMDQGSLITIDVLLTPPSQIEGGALQTLEPTDKLESHQWEQGDALVFLSHKYHWYVHAQSRRRLRQRRCHPAAPSSHALLPRALPLRSPPAFYLCMPCASPWLPLR